MRVAGYCRLSRDEDKENYASIEEQKRILCEYAKSRNWILTDDDFYIDDNVSGYTFNREYFSLMMLKVRRGDIDVVLAKDLSRIGRNNGKVLVLIDEFKTMQRNLILVSEMGGVYDVLNDRDDTIGITTWYNERYVKDCSKKTRDHMYSKQKDGRLIMGNYYGYEKRFDADGIPQLYVIEELRPVIETIFKLYTENNYGFNKIARILNKEYDYPTPSKYYKEKHLERGRVYKHKVQENWTKDMVAHIIVNEVYTGKLITHKKKTITIRGKAIKLPKDQHFEFENHHEPIISKEIFDLAQEIRNKKARRGSSAGIRKRNYFFSGMCVCGECGSTVSGVIIRRKERRKGYECSVYRELGPKGCVFHEIEETDILIQLKEFLKVTKKAYQDDIKRIKIDIKDKKRSIDKDKMKEDLRILKEEYKILLSQKIKDLTCAVDMTQREIIKNTYAQLEKDKTSKISNLQQLIKKNEKSILEEKIEKRKEAIEYFNEIIKCTEPNKITLELLIDKIYIYQDKTIRFELKPNIKRLLSEDGE